MDLFKMKNKKLIIKPEDMPKIRKPTAKGSFPHKDKSKYNRRKKHKGKDEE